MSFQSLPRNVLREILLNLNMIFSQEFDIFDPFELLQQGRVESRGTIELTRKYKAEKERRK